ncbi:hypothetical protein IE53DRAFT_390315 [Violaceomyces palustris]|uniref:Uncharacterized protein n=1 Tax=Violaceomyces palustris TaxID=1673888 RepID=A0ACD0NNZ5_9BASI|nr:hypothetical protein IE53DRAFT_390315 [Violaceomyces palustris]
MVLNISTNTTKSGGKDQDVTTNALPALGAFLSTKSRISSSSSNRPKLSPEEVAAKIASILRPGPPFYSRVTNDDLIDHISDANVMNSEEELQRKASNNNNQSAPGQEEGGVATVWSSLESLPVGSSWGRIPSLGSSSPQQEERKSQEEEGEEEKDDGLWTSLMLTCDLEFTKVGIAKSYVIPSSVLEENHYFKGNQDRLYTSIGAGKRYKVEDWSKPSVVHRPSFQLLFSLASYQPQWTSSIDMWKWPSWVPLLGEKEGDGGKPVSGGGDPDPSSPPPPPPPSKGSKRVWIPSSTKVSLHAAWWGYSLYLPHSVIPDIEGDVDQAEKIANLIKTALTFLVNNIPSTLPSQFATVAVILKAIAPIVGYIATFIGWSWDQIKSFDKGKGVVLSATWILPIALIPRSWDAPDSPPTATPVGGYPTTPTKKEPTVVPDQPPSPPPNRTEIFPAPGSTLPPSDPETDDGGLVLGQPEKDMSHQTEGSPLGRSGEKDPSPSLGQADPPADRVPIDAES